MTNTDDYLNTNQQLCCQDELKFESRHNPCHTLNRIDQEP